MAAEKGNKVKVEYTGTLDSGEVFDSSEKQGQPIDFTVGDGKIIKGFEDAVVGMEEGDEKDIRLEANEAYGDRDENLIQKVPRDKVAHIEGLQEGTVLALQDPQGRQIPATVTEMTDQEVSLDLNPPLAGKALNFKLKLVSVEEGDGSQGEEASEGAAEEGSGDQSGEE
mgnify:CR=1 FL=1